MVAALVRREFPLVAADGAPVLDQFLASVARESEAFGVRAVLEGIDMPKVNSYRDGVVGRLYKGLQGLVKSRNVTYVEGEGRLTSPNTVTVDGTAYTGKTGSTTVTFPMASTIAVDYVESGSPANSNLTIAKLRRARYLLDANDDSGTFLISELTDLNQAAFVAGVAASIDFEETNGRTDFAFRSQSGLVSDVTTETAAVNLCGSPQGDDFGNNYNYYGAVGAATTEFNWLQRGIVTGDFRWFDSYVNQIVMNNAFQLALLELQNNAKSIPYTVSGYNLVETALADPIAQFLRFGAFAPGDITNAQKVAVNTAAGINIAETLQTQGYYLQVSAASGAQRSGRTSPPIKFWYLDRGSIQAISLDSIALQ